MYLYQMKNRTKFFQLSFCNDDSYKERYFIIVEMNDGAIPRAHLVPVPQWLVYRSKEYKYHPINWN